MPMEVELNRLIAHFAGLSFQVQGVYRYTAPPGSVGWERTSPFAGFIFPLTGQAQYHFNGTPYLAQRGHVIHGGANMGLDKRVVGNQPWEYVCVLYEITGGETDDFHLQDMHFELFVGQSARLMELLHRLWTVSNLPGSLPLFQTEVLFRCVLEEVLVCARSQKNAGTQVLFEQVSAYIHERYMDALTVHALARQWGINENRLYYIFQKHSGMGPGDYLMMYRLNRARELLITTDLSVQEVAKGVGYGDALYFSRAFSKQFARSPSAFRQKFKNNP